MHIRFAMWRTVMRGWIQIVFAALAFSHLASAQIAYSSEHRQWEVSGFAGYSSSKTFEFQTGISGDETQSSRTVGMAYDSGYQAGLRIDENLGDHWGAALEYSFANQRLRFTNLSPEIQELSLNTYLHHLTYSVSFLPLPRDKRFRPYGSAGIGAALFYLPGRVKNDALELALPLRDSWEITFNWGGGFKYLIIDEFALTFDFKNRLSRVPSYGLPSSANVAAGRYEPGISTHGVMQIWQVNLGLTFQWDEF